MRPKCLLFESIWIGWRWINRDGTEQNRIPYLGCRPLEFAERGEKSSGKHDLLDRLFCDDGVFLNKKLLPWECSCDIDFLLELLLPSSATQPHTLTRCCNHVTVLFGESELRPVIALHTYIALLNWNVPSAVKSSKRIEKSFSCVIARARWRIFIIDEHMCLRLLSDVGAQRKRRKLLLKALTVCICTLLRLIYVFYVYFFFCSPGAEKQQINLWRPRRLNKKTSLQFKQ